jgi:hypothetical protein
MDHKIINLTPHPVTLCDDKGNVYRTFQPEPQSARISSVIVRVGDLDGVPISITSLGEVLGLPDPKENVWLIVSQAVKNNLPGRKDLLIPVEKVTRNNRTVGCKSLGV